MRADVVTPFHRTTGDVSLACYDTTFRDALRESLMRAGIEAHGVEPDDARALHDAPHVVVLELRPYERLDVVTGLRHASRAAMVVVIDAERTVDPVEAIHAGADDFVVKPCALREVTAKVAAWLRRLRDGELLTVPEFGALDVDVGAREVRVHGRLVAVPPKEFDLLAFLSQRPHRVFTRSELLGRVWSASDAWLGPATVTEHVRRLRHRIEDDPAHPRWIRTVRRVGYRFEPAAVSEIA